RGVDDVLRDRLRAVEHHLVDHLRDEGRSVDRVRRNRPGLDLSATRHQLPRFAPSRERACLRSETPDLSRAARMISYRKPGRAPVRPPRLRTTECSCTSWPSPGL